MSKKILPFILSACLASVSINRTLSAQPSALVTGIDGRHAAVAAGISPPPGDAEGTAIRKPYPSAAALYDSVQSSVLGSGRWYKVKILQDGIYRLTYEDIVDMGFTNPSGVRIYGNGGVMLPLMNGEPRIRDLAENPVYMHTGSDGQFSQGDYILFYGKGTGTWTWNPSSGLFEQEVHAYSTAAYYFVTTAPGTGKRIVTAAPPTEEPTAEVSSFDDYAGHELNKYNFLKSGRQWFGEPLAYQDYDTTITLANLVTSSPVRLMANVVSRSAGTRTFLFSNGSQPFGSISVDGVNLGNSTGIFANQEKGIYSFFAASDQLQLRIAYNRSDLSDEGYLDYFYIKARRGLVITSDAFFFRDVESTLPGSIARFRLDNAVAGTVVWDITDRFNISQISTQAEGGTLSFTAFADQLREYVAVNTGGSFPDVILDNEAPDTGLLPNQNLHHASPCNMVIVTHPLFLEAADSLAALHSRQDGLSVLVATTEQVYNEFSSGAPDVSAIRDFARMVYSRASSEDDRLRYLLLLGDGSYNNLSQKSGNSNFIPTYQSRNSLNASISYVSDDFFGFMDEQEGGSDAMENFLLDIGVGRLPAKTAAEAMTLYEKIRDYSTPGNRQDWRNTILFVGDDEDMNLHMAQADELADWVISNHPEFVVRKVLLDAYRQVSTSTGARYPEVNRSIYENIHRGVLIFNYTGHGGERGLAAEQILMREDLQSFSNKTRLPLFVTATCEFSRFDDLTDEGGTLLESTSAGETALLNPRGGSIALLSTTRIAYSDRNHYLNTQFYRVAFQRDSKGRYYRLGDIIRMTKDSSGAERNKLNFILLGDPALTLAVPDYRVVTDSLNGIPVTAAIDTLKAFSHVRISGHIEDRDNQPAEHFNGIIYPSVFDKVQTITTLGNDGGDPLEYASRDNLLFKGKASVASGRFSFGFIVPKDISYAFGNGKIVYYAEDSLVDAHGCFTGAIIGGTSSSAVNDERGPDITLYLNDEHFNNQGITNNSPLIFARITDSSGINTTGNGIGHDITGIIDGEVSSPLVLNDFYETDLDDYRSGTLRYQMTGLSEGWHSLSVKAWDIYNNSSEETISFRVLPSQVLLVANVINYPNPATHKVFFQFEHNRPDEALQVNVRVYDLSGRLVASFGQEVFSTGFNSSPLEWNLKDGNGNSLGQGLYPYRIRISDSKGSTAESYGKLSILKQ